MSASTRAVSGSSEDALVDRPRGRGRQSIQQRTNLVGWAFLLPAAALITLMSFWPMLKALLLSFQSGRGTRMRWSDPLWYNYTRMAEDSIFLTTLKNTFIYLIVQVPIMLVLALVLASLLNDPNLRFKGLWRTAIFLPCAVGLVSYALVFRTMFANDGMINNFLMKLNLIESPIPWLNDPTTAKIVIILGLLWRWTGYNMIFYLAGLQNIDRNTLEAAKIDGAGPLRTFWYVTIPQLKPMILLTAIMSTNGTLQLFDESFNLTNGGPSNASKSMSHYLYQVSFERNPNFGYASAISYVILVLVAILALVQMKIGDRRD